MEGGLEEARRWGGPSRATEREVCGSEVREIGALSQGQVGLGWQDGHF